MAKFIGDFYLFGFWVAFVIGFAWFFREIRGFGCYTLFACFLFGIYLGLIWPIALNNWLKP
jgi:hypothetical protein